MKNKNNILIICISFIFIMFDYFVVHLVINVARKSNFYIPIFTEIGLVLSNIFIIFYTFNKFTEVQLKQNNEKRNN